jgi:hypothetical protein
MHTPTTKLKYGIESQTAYIDKLILCIDFNVDGKRYIASGDYIVDDGLSGVFVEDENYNKIDKDSDIYQLGFELLTIMEISNNNLTW